MTTITAPIVGIYHRGKLAQAIFDKLPGGAKLSLQPEPDNRFDPKAIKVLVDVGTEVPQDKHNLLESQITGSGYTVEELILTGPFFIGYIADSDGKLCAGGDGNREVGELGMTHSWDLDCSLTFDMQGKPMIQVKSK